VCDKTQQRSNHDVLGQLAALLVKEQGSRAVKN